MLEKNQKPEVKYAQRFFSELANGIRERKLKFESQAQVFLLKRKILLWFRKIKSESTEDYQNRVERQFAQIPTVIDALKDIWSTTDTGVWRYQKERSDFLDKTNRHDNNPLMEGNSFNKLISFHDNLIKTTKLSQEERELADRGFKVLHQIPGYRICEVIGDDEVKRLAFRAIENDLPNNCLGLVLLHGEKRDSKITYHGENYLRKTSSTFLALQDENGKNLVAIELDIKSATTLQVEANKHINRGQVQSTDSFAIPLLKLFACLVKDKRLKVINKVPDLEKLDFVLTRTGEVKNKSEVPGGEVLFPTPIFGEATNLEFPKAKSKLTAQEFFKTREPKKRDLIKSEYVEAGIYQWSEIFKELKIEKLATSLSALKSMDLNKYATDTQITNRLGIFTGPNGEITPETDQSKLFTLEEIQTLMEQQMQFENGEIKTGPLLTNEYSNIFYVKGADNKVGSFDCFWRSGTQEWNVVSRRFGYEWLDGLRVFSRN